MLSTKEELCSTSEPSDSDTMLFLLHVTVDVAQVLAQTQRDMLGGFSKEKGNTVLVLFVQNPSKQSKHERVRKRASALHAYM